MSMSGYLAINILGSLAGPFLYGRLSDKFFRWKTIILFLLCQMLVVSIRMFADVSLNMTPGLGVFPGALQGGLASGLTPAFSERYATPLRRTQAPAATGKQLVNQALPVLCASLCYRCHIIKETHTLKRKTHSLIG